MRIQLPLYLVSSIITLAAADTTSAVPLAASGSTQPQPTSPAPRWLPFGVERDQGPLRPPDALPTPDISEDAFESFDEWKRRREEELEPEPDVPAPEETTVVEQHAINESTADPVEDRNGSNGSGSDATVPMESASLNMNVNPGNAKPTRGHRYNYAAPDCGSRVLSTSPSTQHGSSLLHKSKDRYMLTPCRADEHWVVVELCDEIRVEAVEVAVWEFFSGIVRGVRVSVGDDADSGDWTQVGEFVGKNARGAQIFTLPQVTNFRRFLRIDFPSFYGTEYYCPVSHLKVYGMNQMEAFKMEQRAAAEAKDAQQEKLRERERERAREVEAERAAAVMAERDREVLEHAEEAQRERELCELERLVQEQARRSSISSAETLFSEDPIECPAPTSTSNCSMESTFGQAVNGSVSGSDIHTNRTQTSLPDTPTNSTQNTTLNASAHIDLPSYRGSLRSDASESIYAFIIRRLNALEGNSTLVARYIDEQAKALRASLARSEKQWESSRAASVAEEAARAEAERVRQDARLTRIMGQLDSMRATFETERRHNEAQLRVMAEELGFERRRSLAQLILLISIIVLGAITRGEMIDALLRPLVAEVLKRRSSWDRERERRRDGLFQRRLSTGPLAGMVIDVPLTSPVARPLSTSPKRRPVAPTSVSVRRREVRSISAAEFSWLDEDTPIHNHRSRGVASNRARKLARSSHLHTMPRREDTSASEAEDSRLRSEWTEDGLSASASEVDDDLGSMRFDSPRKLPSGYHSDGKEGVHGPTAVRVTKERDIFD